MSKVVKIGSLANPYKEINRAADIIHSGGSVIFPAKCLYGIAVDALNSKAVNSVFNIKKRPSNNPLLVLIDDIGQFNSLIKPNSKTQLISDKVLALIDKFWPGNITLVFEALPSLPEALTAGTGRIGVRVPGHPVARALAKAAGRPITGTSANISGKSGCKAAAELEPEIIESVDMILDDGILKGGIGSTVIDVTCNPIKILRQGEIVIDIKSLF